jgi:hypothetical protein
MTMKNQEALSALAEATASSKEELKKRLIGIATEVQANDKSGYDKKEVVERGVYV